MFTVTRSIIVGWTRQTAEFRRRSWLSRGQVEHINQSNGIDAHKMTTCDTCIKKQALLIKMQGAVKPAFLGGTCSVKGENPGMLNVVLCAPKKCILLPLGVVAYDAPPPALRANS